jgi:iduronate 2-sulfatase
LFDESPRVPLIVYAPGMKGNGTSSPRAVELLDVYPTIKELCRLPDPPQKLEGHSLVPLLQNPRAPSNRPAFAQVTRNKSKGNVIMGYSVRTERWRYTEWGIDGKEGIELYDHKADAREFTNLAGDPKYGATRAEMAKLLKALAR